MSIDPQQYYAQQGIFTDPFSFRYLFDDLPSDLDALCGIVNGLIVHHIWRDIGQLEISEERRKEDNIRSIQAKLRRILEMDSSPLTKARPFEARLYGNCRDQSLMLCSFLRHFGIPARMRNGFMANFGQLRFDHAICEVWSNVDHRWLVVDVQIDNMLRECHRLPPDAESFLTSRNSHDTKPEDFLHAGKVWQRCRSGVDAPLLYGIEGDNCGWFMIRHSLLRDLLSLNKLELIPWDQIPGSLICLDRADPTPEQFAFLDHVAEITLAADGAFNEVLSLYQAVASLHVPDDWANS